MAPRLTRSDTVEVIFVDLRLQLEAGLRDDLTQALASVADLARLDVHVGQPAGDRCTDHQIVELGAGDLEACLQSGEFAADLRDLATAQGFLLGVRRDLQGQQLPVVVEFVVDLFVQVARDIALGQQGVAPLGDPLQPGDVVLDLGGRLFVGDAGVLQLLFVALELGDRLHQAALSVQHLQFQLGVAEPQQRLADGQHVAGLGKNLLHLAAFQRIEVDHVLRLGRRAQDNEIVEHAALDGSERDVLGRHAHAGRRTGHHREAHAAGRQNQRCDAAGEHDPTPPPRRPFNRSVHHRCHGLECRSDRPPDETQHAQGLSAPVGGRPSPRCPEMDTRRPRFGGEPPQAL
jgi:hypothetical protein